jgi:hypothetical protein
MLLEESLLALRAFPFGPALSTRGHVGLHSRDRFRAQFPVQILSEKVAHSTTFHSAVHSQ